MVGIQHAPTGFTARLAASAKLGTRIFWSRCGFLLVVVAANSRTQNKAESPRRNPPRCQPKAKRAPAQPLRCRLCLNPPRSRKETKAPPKAAAVATIGEAAKPAPMHHPMVEAQAVAAPAAVQGSSKPDKEPRKAVAGPANPQGDAIAGRQVFKKCQACHSLESGKASWAQAWPASSAASPAPNLNFNYSPAIKQAALTWDGPPSTPI